MTTRDMQNDDHRNMQDDDRRNVQDDDRRNVQDDGEGVQAGRACESSRRRSGQCGAKFVDLGVGLPAEFGEFATEVTVAGGQ